MGESEGLGIKPVMALVLQVSCNCVKKRKKLSVFCLHITSPDLSHSICTGKVLSCIFTALLQVLCSILSLAGQPCDSAPYICIYAQHVNCTCLCTAGVQSSISALSCHSTPVLDEVKQLLSPAQMFNKAICKPMKQIVSHIFRTSHHHQRDMQL